MRSSVGYGESGSLCDRKPNVCFCFLSLKGNPWVQKTKQALLAKRIGIVDADRKP